MSEKFMQLSPDVDFYESQNVQVSFNDHIYNIEVRCDSKTTEIKFSADNDILNGAVTSFTGNSYFVKYNGLMFEGEISELSESFLPYIICSFFNSFEENIKLDLYNEGKECYYVKSNINNYFVLLEAYVKNGNIINYSMEIK